jgi:4'-phosphopantetheinyl transferase EntD
MARALDEIVRGDAIAVEAADEDWEAPLAPGEAAAVSGAIERRRREFAAGRACARRALAQLGVPVAELPSGADRVPQWPPGVIGSISHTRGWCAAVVARCGALRGIGLDGERLITGERANIFPMIAQPAEWAALGPLASEAELQWAGTLLFCAKEAAYKAQYPLTGLMLEFDDVEIAVDLPARAFTARVPRARLPRVSGRFATDGDLLIAFAIID